MPELPDNPYVTPGPPEKSEAFRSFVWSLIRLALVTQRHAPDSTFAYANTVLLHTPMYTNGDHMAALYAAHFEFAAYVQHLLGVDAPLEIEVEPARCGAPECVVNHESEAVILEAAVRGDAQVIANVCKATVRDASELDPIGGRPLDGEDALIYLFMGLLQRLHQVLAARASGGGSSFSLN